MAVKKSGRCVIISGAPNCNADFIAANILTDDYIICADGGYKYAQKCNIKPDLFVGDFDSFKGTVQGKTEVIRLKVHKDDTDTMHCAKIAIEKGFSEVVILGAIGGRIDHSFANISILQYFADNNVSAKIITENEILQIASVGEHSFYNLKGYTFSVFPFGCNEVIVSYEGDVEYKAQSLTLYSSTPMGVSNIFLSDNVKIIVKQGYALIVAVKEV